MKVKLIIILLFIFSSTSLFAQTNNISLKSDFLEADAVIDILNKLEKKESINDSIWQNIFITEPYQKLKTREAAFKRPFTDEDFKNFVLTKLPDRKEDLKNTLNEWKKAKFDSIASGIIKYLPEGASINAKVFVVIKPKQNSFIWSDSTGKHIFLYLNTSSTKDQFENTVAHESHHIGMMSLEKRIEDTLKNLSPSVKKAAEWISAFGEGEAMLAAAGSPDRHPHWCSSDSSKQRWDSDMLNFNSDLHEVEKLFSNILNGKLKSDEEIMKAAESFWGYQGAWYTVGYKMAAMIEKEFGREKLVSTYIDQRNFVLLYNETAKKFNLLHDKKLAIWSDEFVKLIKN
jgi:hypothetical protein